MHFFGLGTELSQIRWNGPHIKLLVAGGLLFLKCKYTVGKNKLLACVTAPEYCKLKWSYSYFSQKVLSVSFAYENICVVNPNFEGIHSQVCP